jgi:hypothetical protein
MYLKPPTRIATKILGLFELNEESDQDAVVSPAMLRVLIELRRILNYGSLHINTKIPFFTFSRTDIKAVRFVRR